MDLELAVEVVVADARRSARGCGRPRSASEPAPFRSTTSKRPSGFAISSTATPRAGLDGGRGAAGELGGRGRELGRARGAGSPSWVPQPGSAVARAPRSPGCPGPPAPDRRGARTAVCAEWPAPARRTVLPAQSARSRGEVGDVAPDLPRERALARRRDAAVAQAVGVARRCRWRRSPRRPCSVALAAGLVGEQEAEGAPAALRRWRSPRA